MSSAKTARRGCACITTSERIGLVEVRQLVAAAGASIDKRYVHESLRIEGMDCPTCATVIEHALGRLDGVLEAKVSYAAERLRLEYDSEKSSHRAVERRIEALGYRIFAVGSPCRMVGGASGAGFQSRRGRAAAGRLARGAGGRAVRRIAWTLPRRLCIRRLLHRARCGAKPVGETLRYRHAHAGRGGGGRGARGLGRRRASAISCSVSGTPWSIRRWTGRATRSKRWPIWRQRQHWCAATARRSKSRSRNCCAATWSSLSPASACRPTAKSPRATRPWISRQ